MAFLEVGSLRNRLGHQNYVQFDGRQLGHGLDAHVAVLELPFVVGFEQHCTNEAND